MYNEQFFQLFESLAGDGELTPQEQEVLERTGEAMGIDGEKFMIYLEARLTERFERLKQQPGGEEQIVAIMQRYEKAIASLPGGASAPVPAAGQEQRKNAGPEHHEEIGKCPACKETISGLNHVCPSCGLVIDADHDTHGSLEEMLEQQEQLLLQAKVQARRATSLDLGLAYLVVPFSLICLGELLAYYASMEKTCLGLWVLAFVVYRVQRKSYKAQQAATAGRPLPELEDAFEKNDRQIALFFGDDARVGQALHTLRQQLATAKATIQAKRKFPVGRVLVRLVVLSPILIPWIIVLLALAFPNEPAKQAKVLIEQNRLEEARPLIDQLPATNKYRVVLVSNYYSALTNQRLDSLQGRLRKHQYAVVRQGLLGLKWNDNYSVSFTAHSDFDARKQQLNAQLPLDYRLTESDLRDSISR